MKTSDILRPKSRAEIFNTMSIWYHINSSAPTFSLFMLLRAGLLWFTYFFIVAILFVAAFFIQIYRFDFSDFGGDIVDTVEDIGENLKILDRDLPNLIIKYGYFR